MEVYEAVNRRRSIRQFEDREIPCEVPKRIPDAGLKAPFSDHQRQWELVMLGCASPDAKTPTRVKAAVENKVRWYK